MKKQGLKTLLDEVRLKQAIKGLITEILNEGGGEEPGKMELVNTTLEQAKQYAQEKGILDQIPDFEKHFKYAQTKAGTGRTQRKDMPVINDDDVKEFQTRLKNGNLDIKKPFSPTTDTANPFPEGLKGFQAQDFVERGLKDGSKTDDVISISILQKPVGSLLPIQKQIYMDKSMDATAKFGVEGTRKFLTTKTFFITSADNYIIDGHHRFLSGVLIDPSMKVNCLSIDLPIAKLLPLSTAYGDAIGNERNA